MFNHVGTCLHPLPYQFPDTPGAPEEICDLKCAEFLLMTTVRDATQSVVSDERSEKRCPKDHCSRVDFRSTVSGLEGFLL